MYAKVVEVGLDVAQAETCARFFPYSRTKVERVARSKMRIETRHLLGTAKNSMMGRPPEASLLENFGWVDVD